MAQYEVEYIVDHKLYPNGDATYLIKWKDYDLDQATWEPKSSLIAIPEVLAAFTDAFNKQSSVRVFKDFTKKRPLDQLKKHPVVCGNGMNDETVVNPADEEEDDGGSSTTDAENMEVEGEEDILGNLLNWKFSSEKRKLKLGLNSRNKGNMNIKRDLMEKELAKIQLEKIDADCIFCSHPHASALCRKIVYCPERRLYAQENEICLKCAEPKKEAHVCTTVVICAFCRKRSHNTIFCGLNSRRTWHS